MNSESPTASISKLTPDPKTLPKPSQYEFASFVEGIGLEDWLASMKNAALYVLAVACHYDPHLQELRSRLALLQEDAAEVAAEEWPLILVEVEQDLERCLADWPMGFVRFSLDLVRTWSSGQLEWKPEILLRLVRGRLARGEGDAAQLAQLEEAAKLLVEQARQCAEDDQKILAWQRELKEHYKILFARRA